MSLKRRMHFILRRCPASFFNSSLTVMLICLLILTLTQSVLTQQSCEIGFIRVNRLCVDEDECDYEEPICGNHAICINTLGSYYCQCEDGFNPRGNFTLYQSVTCKDINECSENSIDCGPNAFCQNSEGRYDCICNDGYISSTGLETFTDGQGVQCFDKHECLDLEICGKNATCHNIPGHYYCTCDQGFRLKSGQTNFNDSQSCESVCDIDKFICGEGSCKNSKDGHECVCKLGFTNYGDKRMKCTESEIVESIWRVDVCTNGKDGDRNYFRMSFFITLLFIMYS